MALRSGMFSLAVSALLAPAVLASSACTTSGAPAAGGAGTAPSADAPPQPAADTSSPTSAMEEPPVQTEVGPLQLSGLAQWCPGCTSAGGDTTDFDGVPFVPPGCSPAIMTSELTVAEALARGIDPAQLPFVSRERFETDVHWRQQDRSSRVTGTAQLNEPLLLRERLPIEAGSGESCGGPQLQGSVHVTLDTDDGAIAGAFDAPLPFIQSSSWSAYDRKLTANMDWSATQQLRGNLQVVSDGTRTPVRLGFQFLWYRIDEIPADRVGIGITLYYQEPKPPPCVGSCWIDGLATAVPPDDCLPWELPSNGVCGKIEDHPEYGAGPSSADAGVSPPLLDAGL